MSKDDKHTEAAKHIRVLAQLVHQSNQDKKQAEAIWKASSGKKGK
jgi:hypothetical protein